MESLKSNLSPSECKIVGNQIARMHQFTKILNSQGIMIYQLNPGKVFFHKLRTSVIKDAPNYRS